MEQHSELSHEGDENEVMLQTGPQVLPQLREPKETNDLDDIESVRFFMRFLSIF